MTRKMRIAIDVGGTFTDLIGTDPAGRVVMTKTFTTPGNLVEGVLTGIHKFVDVAKGSKKDVGEIVHGTTIGTNALIERKGAKIGLLTTAGFRDILEIGRVQRPEEGLYDFNVDNPPPLVPRRLRKEAVERVDGAGKVLVPLDRDSVARATEEFRKENVRAVAVCFLFSFLNPEHERQARDILQKALPGVFISISSDIAPEFREFERTSTVVINSYLQPLIDEYVGQLEENVKSKYPIESLRLIQANGGSMRSAAARGRAVNLVNSGPAGGATAAAFLSRSIQVPRVIAVDMGGTSFDISLIEEGAAGVTTDAKFEGYPIKVQMCELNIIGAGGGSLAWIDTGGALNVGPQSAGAMPGPVCYNRGGTNPTVTDANVALGRIDPHYFLGGEIKLDKGAAEEAIAKVVGEKLHLSVEESAWSILRIINATMAKAISVRSTQKGYDLREFGLVPFGGAGPLHAVEIAEELGIPQVIVPPYPAAFSAFGLLMADVRYDLVRAHYREPSEVVPSELWNIFQDLSRAAETELERDGVEPARRSVRWSADLRFEGQSYELNIPIGENLHRSRTGFGPEDVERIYSGFSAMHERVYAFKSLGEKVYFVNLRVTGIGRSEGVQLPVLPEGTAEPRAALKGKRRVYFGQWLETDIYERRLLKSGNIVTGPAVIEEEFSCTVIPPKRSARIDRVSNIIISV